MYTIFIIANSSEALRRSLSLPAALRFKLNMLISAVFIIKLFSFKLEHLKFLAEAGEENEGTRKVLFTEKTSLESFHKFHYE